MKHQWGSKWSKVHDIMRISSSINSSHFTYMIYIESVWQTKIDLLKYKHQVASKILYKNIWNFFRRKIHIEMEKI